MNYDRHEAATSPATSATLDEPPAERARWSAGARAWRWVVFLWIFALVCPAIASLVMIFGFDIETDFQELYEQGRHVLTTGRLDAKGLGFYPPSAVPVYLLFAWMPAIAAAFVSCVVYGLLHFLSVRTLPTEAMRIEPWQSWHAWLFLALLMGGYLYHDIVTGQVSAIPVFATILGFVCWRRGRVVAASAALALGIAFKLLPGVCVLFFLIKRQWRMVALTGMFTAAFAILPGLALFGPSELRAGWQEYREHVSGPKMDPVGHPDRIRWTKPASFLNPALGVTLLRWFSDYPRDRHAPFLPVLHLPQAHVYRFYLGLMGVMGAVTLWCCRRRPEDEPPEATATQYGLLLVWMVLLSPHLAIYYMAWALWPVAVIMGHVARRDRLERRHDLFNEAILGLWGAVFVIQPESTLRAIGIHPAMLLVLWLALLVNILRANRNTNLWPAR